ncbi:hypothetical protein AAC387_Pa12g0324 [Persea americana]
MLFYLTTLNLARLLHEEAHALKEGEIDKPAKELWDSLDKKYKTEDAKIKKFVVGRFLDYKMVDSKAVINQVQEL